MLDLNKYHHPKDILGDQTLSKKEKIDMLKQWEYDLREMAVAEEENMPSHSGGKAQQLLDDVFKALHSLGIFNDESHSGSHKQGGN